MELQRQRVSNRTMNDQLTYIGTSLPKLIYIHRIPKANCPFVGMLLNQMIVWKYVRQIAPAVSKTNHLLRII